MIEASSLHVEGEVLHWDSGGSIPTKFLSQITIIETSWNRKKSFWRGFAGGAFLGAIPGGIGGWWWSCYETYNCEGGLTGKEVGGTTLGAIVGGISGGLVMGAIAAALGRKQTTLYRFNGGSVSATPGTASVRFNLGR